MPSDLVGRISASIAAERERGGAVTPLAAPNPAPPRRPWWRTVGLAAAAAAVVGVGGASLLTGTSPGDLGALFGSTGADSSAAGASAVRDQEGAGDSGSGQAPPRVGTPGATVSVHHRNAAYTMRDFPQQASGLLADPGETLAPGAAESPAIGPIGTEVGLRSCLSAVTTEAFAQVTADLGTFEGTPAAVLVLTTDTGHTAYAVERTCTGGHAAVLAGPVPLP
jgi:hypothetical protein